MDFYFLFVLSCVTLLRTFNASSAGSEMETYSHSEIHPTATMKNRAPDGKSTAPIPQDCPAGWETYGSKCLGFSGRQRQHASNWNGAQKICLENGATMLSIHSEKEQDFLEEYLGTNDYEKVWIGLEIVKTTGASELQWTDGSSVNYKNWKTDEEGTSDSLQQRQCGKMDYSDGARWSKVNCEDMMPFICQKPKSKHAQKPRNQTDPLKTAFIVVCAILGTATVVSLIFVIKFYRNKKILEGNWLFSGSQEIVNPNFPMPKEEPPLPPFDEKWEFPRKKLKFGRTLEDGTFGRVIKAKAKEIREDEPETMVAVKTRKDRSDQQQTKILMNELKFLIHIGHHINILKLLGAVTINPRRLMVIVEYCRHGNLKDYLFRNSRRFLPPKHLNPGKKKHRRPSSSESSDSSTSYDLGIDQYGEAVLVKVPASSDQTTASVKGQKDRGLDTSSSSDSSDHSNTDNRKRRRITMEHLMTYSFQCAKGMEYLASMKVIHGDVAARSVVLADNDIVKISNFGLAKDMDQYNPSEDGITLLPIKWMAIESIEDKMFSTKSDVWSFGVLLWEIFALGRNPYTNIPVDKKFIEKLKEGYRMGKPKNAPANIYKIMTDCWSVDPADRPDFKKLTALLGDIIPLETKGVDVNHELPDVIEDHSDSNAAVNGTDDNLHPQDETNSIQEDYVSSPLETDSYAIEMSPFAYSVRNTGRCNSTNASIIAEDKEKKSTTYL